MNLCTNDFTSFSSWADVVAHCKANHPLYYQAPFDRIPVRVDYKLPTRRPRGSLVPGDGWKGCIRILPRTDESDPFVAFSDHLSRMRKFEPALANSGK